MRGVARLLIASLLLTLLPAGWAGASPTADVQLDAFAGKPFGVGKMTVGLGSAAKLFPDSPIRLTERQARVLYPAVQTTGVLESDHDSTTPRSVTVFFVFQGDEPLDVTLHLGSGRESDVHWTATAKPIENQPAHQTQLAAWWKQYTRVAGDVFKSDVYPPVIECYLTDMLSNRLGLTPRNAAPSRSFWRGVDDFIALLSGAESVRLAAQSEIFLEPEDHPQRANQPLPEPLKPPPVNLPKTDDVTIEPIAMHVPQECFYVRCGSFSNFLWLKAAFDDWGTNVRDLASLRGLDNRIGPRLERQLALRETVLAKLLGDAVVSDVAILGTDTFLRTGPSIGVLFEARNTAALELQIRQQRDTARKVEPNAREDTVQIAGRDVSLLATSDNRVRSFYAIDGQYHLVTTSRTIVRRFFEAGRGQQSLGALKEFHWARSTMPLSQQYTAFVYLSDPFFRLLIGPHYRIEMTRRVQAAAEIDVARLARLASTAEGNSTASIPQLIAAGLLPFGFETRPDGSRVVLSDAGPTDSLRGDHGSFLPVPDVEIAAATQAEVAAYKRFADKYNAQWRRVDPVAIGIHRQVLPDPGKERVVLDVHITPYARSHYAIINMFLAPADQKAWAAVPGEVGSIQANLKFGGKYAVGIVDWSPSFTIENGSVDHESEEADDNAYFLAPKVGNGFSLGSIQREGPVDEDGNVPIKQSFIGSQQLWMRDLTDYGLCSQSKELLGVLAPQVQLIDVDRAAQGRLRIADLAEMEIAAGMNAESYMRARKISGGNAALLRAIEQQLHVPVDQVESTAEELLGARLVCPLGGDYELRREGASLFWYSTAWQDDSLYLETEIPDGFRAPFLDWFAGLLIELNIDNNVLSTHIELDVRSPQ